MDAASYLLLILLATIVALMTAVSFSFQIRKREEPSPLAGIAEMIRKGGALFFHKENTVSGIFVLAASLLFFFFFDGGGKPFMTASFLFGAALSAATGHVGMHTAGTANIHTAMALKTNPARAFRMAFVSGATMGLSVVGLSLLGITLTLYILYVIFGATWETSLRILGGFGAGISSSAFFARVGGAIFASAMKRREEPSVEEDVPQGSIIPECVGNNVGGLAGLGSDVLESYVLAIIAAVSIGWSTIRTETAIFFPLMIAAFGILTSVIASAFVRTRKHTKAAKALRRGVLVNTVLLLLATFILARRFFPAEMAWEVSIAFFAGLVASLLTRFLMGRAPSSRNVGTFVLLLILAIAIAEMNAGLYGIALAAVGMLSILGSALAADASVPVLMNASMIASTSDLGGTAKKNAQELMQGNDALSTIGKGYAAAASLLSALALAIAYSDAALLPAIDLKEPVIFIGILLGGILPFLFSSMIIHAAGNAAHTMAETRRRQRSNPLLLLAPTATTAILEVTSPALLAIGAPLLVGFVLGSPALIGLLMGSIVTGLPLSISMLRSNTCDSSIGSLLKMMAIVSLLTATKISYPLFP